MCDTPASGSFYNSRPDAPNSRRSSSVRPIGFGELSIGGIAIALENAPPARKMPFDAFGGAAVFEAVDDDRGPAPR